MLRRDLRARYQGVSPAWAVAGVPKARNSRRTHAYFARRAQCGLWPFGPMRLVPKYLAAYFSRISSDGW